ncbi:transposase [Paenibacillus sp. FSL K6-2524]|uniref:transposase n=1 Tax=Paenibacillus sp. FSL K6-2524 TaxID=2954516 RepID=UPI0030FB9051
MYQSYTEEFKVKAVKVYLEGCASYETVAEKLGIRNCTQLSLGRKHRDGEAFDTRKDSTNPMKGRPRMHFPALKKNGIT